VVVKNRRHTSDLLMINKSHQELNVIRVMNVIICFLATMNLGCICVYTWRKNRTNVDYVIRPSLHVPTLIDTSELILV